MDIRQVAAENIRFIRQKRQLSQEALAGKTGISVSYIGYIERGDKAITIVKLEKIAKVLNVTPGLLLEPGAHHGIK